MKARKGYTKININGEIFLFNFTKAQYGAQTEAPPLLIMYNSNDKKIVINRAKYKIPENPKCTWHGKKKNGAEYGGWGKYEARHLYLAWKAEQDKF